MQTARSRQVIRALRGLVLFQLCCWTFFAGLPTLLGCSKQSPVEGMIRQYLDQGLSPSNFVICKDYGCYSQVEAALTDEEWQRIAVFFEPSAKSAVEERDRIVSAIAQMEQMVGEKTGTSGDRPKSPVFIKFDHGQMDCVDESFNTTIYLTLFTNRGVIRWHEVGQPFRRGYLFDCWAHNTATIIERESGARFAVDSWFHANGEAPEIVPIDQWLSCWSPEQ